MSDAGVPTSSADRERPRLFVAVLLPDAWLKILGTAQDRLRADGLRLRYVRPEGAHLTLKFLGETPVAKLEGIGRALTEAARATEPFALEMGAAGCFGTTRQPRVIWVGVDGDRVRLTALHDAVDTALAREGFAQENRPFNPHLTLARVPDTLPRETAERIAEAVKVLGSQQAPAHRVENMVLMQSTLGPGGARYAILRMWALGTPAPP